MTTLLKFDQFIRNMPMSFLLQDMTSQMYTHIIQARFKNCVYMWGQAPCPSSVGEAVRFSGTHRAVSPSLAPQTFSPALAHLPSSRRGRQTSFLPPQSQPRGQGRRAPTSIILSESVRSVSDLVD